MADPDLHQWVVRHEVVHSTAALDHRVVRAWLDRLVQAGVETVGVGKIEDIFCGHGISRSILSEGNRGGMEHTLQLARELDSELVFVNLVDFDSLYGYRRDAVGYRKALEEFDGQLAELESVLKPNDLVFLAADHGNDPAFTQTTDHTCEYVPVLVGGPALKTPINLGIRDSFADLGASSPLRRVAHSWTVSSESCGFMGGILAWSDWVRGRKNQRLGASRAG